jgi:hypothetical protein
MMSWAPSVLSIGGCVYLIWTSGWLIFYPARLPYAP